MRNTPPLKQKGKKAVSGFREENSEACAAGHYGDEGARRVITPQVQKNRDFFLYSLEIPFVFTIIVCVSR